MIRDKCLTLVVVGARWNLIKGETNVRLRVRVQLKNLINQVHCIPPEDY